MGQYFWIVTVLVAGSQPTDAPSASEMKRRGTRVVPATSRAGWGNVFGWPLTVAVSAPSGRMIAVAPFCP